MIDGPCLHDARCLDDGVAHDVDDPALIDDVAHALTRAGWGKHSAQQAAARALLITWPEVDGHPGRRDQKATS